MNKPVAAAGECRCHGVPVSGPLALVSRPKQPYYEHDVWSGKQAACWFITTDTGSHDIAVKGSTVTYEDGSVRVR